MAIDEIVRRITKKYISRQHSTLEVDDKRSLAEMGITSINIIELVLDIERELGVNFPDEELVAVNFTNVAALVQLTKRQLPDEDALEVTW